MIFKNTQPKKAMDKQPAQLDQEGDGQATCTTKYLWRHHHAEQVNMFQ